MISFMVMAVKRIKKKKKNRNSAHDDTFRRNTVYIVKICTHFRTK